MQPRYAEYLRDVASADPGLAAGPDAYASKAEYVGRVAAVPISEGQPITPDLLESAE